MIIKINFRLNRISLKTIWVDRGLHYNSFNVPYARLIRNFHSSNIRSPPPNGSFTRKSIQIQIIYFIPVLIKVMYFSEYHKLKQVRHIVITQK